MKLLPLLKLAELLPVSKKSPQTLETFGLDSLKVEMVSITNSLINSVNHSSIRFYFTAQEQELLKKRNAKFRQMQDYLANGGQKPPPLQWGDTFQALERKILWRHWSEKQSDQFNQVKYWDDLKRSLTNSTDSCSLIEKVYQLKTQWFCQNQLALHTHQALQEIIQNRLPPLERHYENAQRELYSRKSKMPEGFYQACDAALIKFQSHAARLKRQAAASCLTRLETWDRTAGQCSQPVFYFSEQIASVRSKVHY